MKRLWITASATIGFLVLALPAFAQYPGGGPGEPGDDDFDRVAGGAQGGTGGGLADTGIEIATGVIILVALVVVGTMLLVASRRRKVAATR